MAFGNAATGAAPRSAPGDRRGDYARAVHPVAESGPKIPSSLLVNHESAPRPAMQDRRGLARGFAARGRRFRASWPTCASAPPAAPSRPLRAPRSRRIVRRSPAPLIPWQVHGVHLPRHGDIRAGLRARNARCACWLARPRHEPAARSLRPCAALRLGRRRGLPVPRVACRPLRPPSADAALERRPRNRLPDHGADYRAIIWLRRFAPHRRPAGASPLP